MPLTPNERVEDGHLKVRLTPSSYLRVLIFIIAGMQAVRAATSPLATTVDYVATALLFVAFIALAVLFAHRMES